MTHTDSNTDNANVDAHALIEGLPTETVWANRLRNIITIAEEAIRDKDPELLVMALYAFDVYTSPSGPVGSNLLIIAANGDRVEMINTLVKFKTDKDLYTKTRMRFHEREMELGTVLNEDTL